MIIDFLCCVCVLVYGQIVMDCLMFGFVCIGSIVRCLGVVSVIVVCIVLVVCMWQVVCVLIFILWVLLVVMFIFWGLFLLSGLSVMVVFWFEVFVICRCGVGFEGIVNMILFWIFGVGVVQVKLELRLNLFCLWIVVIIGVLVLIFMVQCLGLRLLREI